VGFCRQPLAVLAISVIQSVALGQSANHVIGMPSFCVSGEPLSATETLDYEPSENSSDPVAVHREAMLYRDSEGRMRTELKYPGYTAVFIQDCVAHRLYNWTVGDTELRCGKLEGVGYVTDKTAAPEGPNKDSAVIEGVSTHHSRLVRKEEDQIEQIYEHWYASSLHLDLLQVFYRPDEGKSAQRIFNLNMAEPDPALFQVPEGFTSRTSYCPAPPGASESYSTIDGNWRLTGAWAEKLGRAIDLNVGVDGNTIYAEGQFPMSCVSDGKSSVMGRAVSVEGKIASDGTFILSNPRRMPSGVPARDASIRGKLPAQGVAQWSGRFSISTFSKTSAPPAECQEISGDFVAKHFPVLNGLYQGTVRVDRNEEAFITLEVAQGELTSTNRPYPFDHVIPLEAKITMSGSSSLPSNTFDTSEQPQENNRVTGRTFQLRFLRGAKDGASFEATGSFDPADETRLTVNLFYTSKDQDGKFRVVHASGRLIRRQS
jgi:hypothetical protein